MKTYVYGLTSLVPTIACFGTSYKSLPDVFAEIIRLQQLGLCKKYSIGMYAYQDEKLLYDGFIEIANNK